VLDNTSETLPLRSLASTPAGGNFAVAPVGLADADAFGLPTVTRLQEFALAVPGLSSAASMGSPSLSFDATTLSVTLTLTTDGTTPAASLTGLKWAFFDQATPDLFTAPTAKGSIETTNGSGVLVIPVPGTALTPGQVGWLTVTDSNGTTTQSPAHKAFSGPVTVA
jgi:hypothetical protein